MHFFIFLFVHSLEVVWIFYFAVGADVQNVLLKMIFRINEKITNFNSLSGLEPDPEWAFQPNTVMNSNDAMAHSTLHQAQKISFLTLCRTHFLAMRLSSPVHFH